MLILSFCVSIVFIAILEATGVYAGAWNAAIKALLEAGKVERQGDKKGARYRAA